MKKKIVLAYSGGLDTSVAVHWLNHRGWDVVCFMADVGQGEPKPEAIKRAKIAGASKVVVRDLREEFAKEYILPALKANAVYEGKYLLGTALTRPLIAKHLVDVAHKEKASAIGHGCTGKGNDQVRFEVTSRALDPSLEIVAPVREWEFRSREEEVDYAHKYKIPITVTKKSPYSIDKNLWGLSVEAGPLEDPWTEPPDDSYQWVKKPQYAPKGGVSVCIEFNKGVPVAVNGKAKKIVELIESLNQLGALHGIGRADLIESRVVGIKSREVYEAPAATILLEAHFELERMVLDRELLHFKQALSIKYAELAYYGLWFTPIKKVIDELVAGTQKKVTGEIRLKLRQGLCTITGRRSPHALYQRKLATYGKEDKFDQSLAYGFIKLWGLPYEGQGF
jgi:argininosuccinate synthase